MQQLALLSSLLIVATSCVSCGTDSSTGASAANAAKSAANVQTVDAVKIVSQKLKITVRLPGELLPHEAVAIYPRVNGFVDWIGVDRGSRVKKGALIARLVAPELISQRTEAQAKLESAEAQRIEAEARLASDESTYQRLKAAAATPGVVSGNELEVSEKSAQADRARVEALRESVEAAKSTLSSVQEIEGYLKLTAPFDGVVTERNVHPGALVGPGGGPGPAVPLVRIEQLSRLRLVVPIPETYAAGIPQGTKVPFSVPAFPGETFTGTVARIAHSVDVKTRTMPVELDIENASARLAAGMFPEVLWPVERPQPTLFVPGSAVVRTTERVFLVRLRQGNVEWVEVKTGVMSGNLIEVFGDLQKGDEVALRGTDELRPGTRVEPRLTSSN